MNNQPVTSLRPQTLEQVLAVLVRAGPLPISRDELVRQTGLARATADKAVRHIELVLQSADSRDMQRADQLALLPAAGYAVGIEFSHRRILVAVADLAREIQLWRFAAHPVDAEPHTSLDQAASLARELLAETGVTPDQVAAVGIAVAAPVHPDLGTLRSLAGGHPAMPGWLGIKPIDELRARLRDWNCPFTLGNDADLAAIDEYRSAYTWWTGQNDLRDLVLLKWSSGIGAGLIINGAPLTGTGGLAGELGHTPISAPDRELPTQPCPRCGRIDCLENLASYDSIRRDLQLPKLTRSELEQRPEGQERLETAAHLLGRALVPLVNTLNPQAILIAGPSPDMHAKLLPAIHTALSHHAIAPAVTELHTRLAEPRWAYAGDNTGRLAVASGAITNALDQHGASYLLRRIQNRHALPATPASASSRPARGARRSGRTAATTSKQ